VIDGVYAPKGGSKHIFQIKLPKKF